MPFIKLSKSEKKKMSSAAGYREKAIMDNSKCVVSFGKDNRYLKVVSKPDRTVTLRLRFMIRKLAVGVGNDLNRKGKL